MNRRRSSAALIAALVLLPACSGGGDSKSSDAACPEPVEAPAKQLAMLPEDIPLEKWGTVTKVTQKGGYIGGEAITDTQIVELYPELNRFLIGHDYVIVSGENEGFEAEVFFQRDRVPGSFLVRKGCGKQIRLRLLFNVRRLKNAK